MKYRLNDFAAAEVRDIVNHYSRRSRGVAVGFVEDLGMALTLLVGNPFIGQAISDDYRHLPLNRFPYYVIYQVKAEAKRISVVSVCHQRRHPDHWRDRVQEESATYAIAA